MTVKAMKPQPYQDFPPIYVGPKPDVGDGCFAFWETGEVHVEGVRCPYGQPGDLLWVRESFWQAARSMQMPCGEYEHYWGSTIEYAEQRDKAGWHNNDQYGKGWMVKRPSIHMSRKQSRLTLRVTDVRVERVQEIGGDDAVAEGAPSHMGGISCCDWFQHRWDSINAKRAPWASNPWVWVVEFERVEAAHA